jgi:hypothetical protein
MRQQFIITLTTEGDEMEIDAKGDMAPMAVLQGLIQVQQQMIAKAVRMLTADDPRYKDGKYIGERPDKKS